MIERRHPERERLLAAIAMIAIVATGCTGLSRSNPAGHHQPSATASPGPTILITFRPYSPAGALSVAVTRHATGSCWTGSIAVAAADAYRCLVGSEIADPCFAPPQPSRPATVACLPDPWSGAQVVTLTEPLPEVGALAHAANPWAVQLSNGAQCVASTGTVQSIDGVSLNLLCAGGSAAGALDTTTPTWQVKYSPKSGGSLAPVGVTRAWRG